MKTINDAFMKTISGNPWAIEVGGIMASGEPVNASISVVAPQPIRVTSERHGNVPLFQEQKWLSGCRFEQLKANECSLSYALLPDSVIIESADGKPFRNGI